jgi:hypothetical protein
MCEQISPYDDARAFPLLREHARATTELTDEQVSSGYADKYLQIVRNADPDSFTAWVGYRSKCVVVGTGVTLQ